MLKYSLRYAPLLLLLLLLLPWHFLQNQLGRQQVAPTYQPHTPYSIGSALYAVTMLSENDVWAVGGSFAERHYAQGTINYPTGGIILHYTNGSWQGIANTQLPLFAITFVSPTDGWAVGYGGTIIHYDGTRWTPIPGPTHFNKNLLGVAQSSPSDVWAVGYSGSLLHYNGQVWTLSQSPTTADLHAIALPTAQEGWAVGASGSILHYQHGSWELVRSAPATHNDLLGLSMLSTSEGWAVGTNGTILHYRSEDGQWNAVYNRAGTNQSLMGVAMSSVRAGWIIGEQQFLRYKAEVWSSSKLTAFPIKDNIANPTLTDGNPSLYGIALSGTDTGWAVGSIEVEINTPNRQSYGPATYYILYCRNGTWYEYHTGNE